MFRELQLDIPILLPEVPDAHDACVARLQALLNEQHGIKEVHVVTPNGGPPALCLHYDPDVLPLAQVERLARTAGASVSDQFGHTVFSIRAIDAEDAGRRIEQGLLAADGVLEAV